MHSFNAKIKHWWAYFFTECLSEVIATITSEWERVTIHTRQTIENEREHVKSKLLDDQL